MEERVKECILFCRCPQIKGQHDVLNVSKHQYGVEFLVRVHRTNGTITITEVASVVLDQEQWEHLKTAGDELFESVKAPRAKPKWKDI